MAIEPGIIDANILIYGVVSEAPQNGAARALLDTARGDPGATLYASSQILCEF